MRLTEADRELLEWLNGHPGGSAIIRLQRLEVADIVSRIYPKLIEIYQWADGSYIGRILPAGRAELAQSVEKK